MKNGIPNIPIVVDLITGGGLVITGFSLEGGGYSPMELKWGGEINNHTQSRVMFTLREGGWYCNIRWEDRSGDDVTCHI